MGCKMRRRRQRPPKSKFEENQDDWLNEEENDEESRGEIPVTIDPDVLNCFVCFEPLRTPLFQCENGHVACCVCRKELPQGKCPTCSHSIKFSRCRALEKVVESIKSSCCYSAYGCRTTLPYMEILPHQVTCAFAPCYCPLSDCNFCGPPLQVSTHFGDDHPGSAIGFHYAKLFTVRLKQDQPFVVLREQRGLLFLLLSEKCIGKGNALSIACIQPSSMDRNFVYKLLVEGDGSTLQLLNACATNVGKWVGVYSDKVFLLVPQNFCSSAGEIILKVCIRLKK